ncbi:rhodanese-related sulfurtransferase [Waterburya agarophytonicola K14]|uniref:tRNA uridine(34) hydroxylase n=1 Tax=Waterburya agarophytonicola KI4 TaxID=2874699 RepID=A0A964BPV8_9CYAN|nr:rhodanese-related sulfurtransferase [Waterburya agarophytonicola]MCC0176662.1 rhodanese-related sulfurtransferase [Waterburya agarophytonicola KI4]
MTYLIATFYKFVTITGLKTKKAEILALCRKLGVKGTIILAQEGINGTISGSQKAIADVLAYLRSLENLADLEHKESTFQKLPFSRLKVKIKSEIVTLGLPEVNPNQQVGTYVDPQDWNKIISDPEVVVIDTRNDYEVEIGSFQRAKNPNTESFREFPEYIEGNLDPTQHPKVAMFCTGGIRCEKASSYMLSQGFKEVYHLKGGILKYLENVSPEESMWEGECFVFDERVAVKEGLEPGSHQLCYGCGHPISEEDKQSPHYESDISCPHCYHQLTPEKKARLEDRRRQREYLKKAGKLGKGF